MKRALCVALIAAAPRIAAGEPEREVVLAAVDFYGGTVGGSARLAAADLASSLHYEGHRLRFDAVDRESLVNGTPRRELHELNVQLGADRDRWSLRLGRQRVAGGFWLLVDGAAIRYRVDEHLSLELIGGLRSVSNARAELVLRRQPTWIPLAGVTATYVTPRVSISASVVSTRDVVSLRRGLDPIDGAFASDGGTPGAPIVVARELPESFVDASGVARISQGVTAFGGISLGNRYEIELSPRPELLRDDPTLRSQLLRSRSVFAVLDHRITRAHRITWSLVAVSAKTELQIAEDAAPRPTGTFAEVGARYGFTPSKRVRLRGQLRVRERDGDLVLRPTAGLVIGPRSKGTAFALDAGAAIRTRDPDALGFVARRTWIVDASVHHRTATAELRAGVVYSDVLPGGVQAATEDDPVALRLYPYTLDAQRFGYVRAFAEHGHWFAGLDLEWALDHPQLRTFVQVGFAR